MQRGFFPRAPWRSALAIIAAGTIADLDRFTAALGPAEYLHLHRTATHSILFVAVLAILAATFKRTVRRKESSVNWIGLSWTSVSAAASLHIVMDLLQSDPVTPLWPFSTRQVSLDVASTIDPWLLIFLIATIAFPELLRLVSDEIGARNKRPRGRTGAIIGLSFALIYLGSRALFHSNVVASLEARTIAGESPRRIAAFPDSASPFLWHSIVETESALHLATLRSMGGEVTYATGVTTLRKPDPSPILSAAQASPAAVTFLQFARFPKATVLKETEGYSVEIQDLKDQVLEEKTRAISADITLNNSAKVISSELQWQRSGPR